MGLSVWHVVVVLVVVLILFGAGKLPQVMGDVAKGIKNFKAGLSDDDKPRDPTPAESAAAPPASIPHQSPTAAPGTAAQAADSPASSGKS